jgi:hypothetical protein
MALAIQDVDNYEPFRNIFSIIDNNSQLLPEGDYISLMNSLLKLRLDLKSMKCSCSGYNFCYTSPEAFLACSNINYLLNKSPVLNLLLPFHKRRSGKINIQFTPNIKDIIIDYQFLDLSAEAEEISSILGNFFSIIGKTYNMKVQVIFCIAIFDITCKYFIVLKNNMQFPDEFYDMCILKLKEFSKIVCEDIKEINKILNIKGSVFNKFLRNFKELN